jgi:ribosomal protein L3 glutamine methyltransferase
MSKEPLPHIAVAPQDLHTVRDWVRFFVSEMRRGQVFFGPRLKQCLR